MEVTWLRGAIILLSLFKFYMKILLQRRFSIAKYSIVRTAVDTVWDIYKVTVTP